MPSSDLHLSLGRVLQLPLHLLPLGSPSPPQVHNDPDLSGRCGRLRRERLLDRSLRVFARQGLDGVCLQPRLCHGLPAVPHRASVDGGDLSH